MNIFFCKIRDFNRIQRLVDPSCNLFFLESHVAWSKGNILINRVREELIVRVLEYQPDFSVDFPGGESADIVAIQGDAAGKILDHAIQKLEQGCFTGTIGTEDAAELSSQDVQLDSGQSNSAVGVAERFYSGCQTYF